MATETDVSKLFIALYNRATDKNVFGTFSSREINPTVVRELISGQYNKKLDISQKISENNRAFVESLYKNVLGRAPNEDKEGIDYWVSLLEGSSAEPKRDPMSKEDFVIAFLTEVQRYQKAAEGNGKLDLVLLDNTKVEHIITNQDRDGIKVFNTKVEVSNFTVQKISKANAYGCTFGKGLSEITATNAETAKQNALSEIKNLALQNSTSSVAGAKLKALEAGDYPGYTIVGIDKAGNPNGTVLVLIQMKDNAADVLPATMVAKIISSIIEGSAMEIGDSILNNIQHIAYQIGKGELMFAFDSASNNFSFEPPKEDLTGSYRIEPSKTAGNTLVYTAAGPDKPKRDILFMTDGKFLEGDTAGLPKAVPLFLANETNALYNQPAGVKEEKFSDLLF